ncbi:uncharacterized protein F5147DRAFT_782555 [Suillus discolor]|uniref:Uncharacterized protein n=1 Tax=Suillus discolor TaxID=1912936 RepID=A0A9P7JL29_9AGAM|nr:uncharacterized protein F5147DRAFT_782555 [Suillus discolor]KAG2084303.1 hypothetical protein F5147DRAFT_782555 [Suillus discolor]
MPIWHHPAIKNNYLWNKPAARCLRNKHNIETVEDLERFAYSNEPNTVKCNAVDQCYNIATIILAELPPKFQLNNEVPQTDNLEHTPNRIKHYQKTKINKDPIAFDPATQSEANNPSETTRIFRESYSYKVRLVNDRRLALPLPMRLKPLPNQKSLTVLLMGSEQDPNMIAVLITTTPTQTKLIRNKSAQNADDQTLTGITYALTYLPNDHITFVTKNPSVPTRLLKSIKEYEDEDWMTITNPKAWKTTISLLRQRGAKTSFQTYNKEHNYHHSLLKKARQNQTTIEWDFPRTH